ncbi:gamma-glutamyl-gamma-aminobutyrate hydrolase family protein [Methylibium sp.]|uniref:gamma-glutamyl-gamma-aminobutyrate hydrolase family protein n=1 Tax=Methylibium sp. TaxID=2067992 RepID=UPI0025EA38C7|nr:gamma-glutamyl-gamma-aminobutyrate hydrolase family protein [Methylibium sp.]
MTARPVVLMPACQSASGQQLHVIGQKYVDAVRLAGGLPLVVPSVQLHELDELLALADGVCLTGSPSNVHPRHFDEVVHDTALPLDTRRDDWTLPLIPRVLALGMPLFAICRGCQELNVALGGSLHQAVQDQPGFQDHRAREDQPAEVQYGPSHPVQVVPGGLLDTLIGNASFQVNSLHGQGIKRLADRLRVEARAPDGVIEAVSLADASGFTLGVQWHPEWQARDNPVSMKLLRAFGDACQSFRERRQKTAHEAVVRLPVP